MSEISENFREWGPNQYNNDGKLFEKKSISNYHSSLNTILVKLKLKEKTGYERIYDCQNSDDFENLYEIILNHSEFYKCNKNSNHTHSSALKLYRRFLVYLEGEKKIAIGDEEIKRIEKIEHHKVKEMSDQELIYRVESKKQKLAMEMKIISRGYFRDQEIAEYARRRSNGICDLCMQEAPFIKADGTPYLESHHIIWLSRGGEDSIDNTVALCPNCHRRIHVLDLKVD